MNVMKSSDYNRLREKIGKPGFDRANLVDRLGIKFKTTEPTEERYRRTRVEVDRQLAKLFGARSFLGRYREGSETYSLDKIREILQTAGVDVGIPVEEFVEEAFIISPDIKDSPLPIDHYYFEENVDPDGRKVYRLRLYKASYTSED